MKGNEQVSVDFIDLHAVRAGGVPERKDALLNCKAAAALKAANPDAPIGGDALKDRKARWAAKKLAKKAV